WVPPILPPAGKERTVKNDLDYWIESERLLKQAVKRLRELRPFLQMLTESHPGPSPQPSSPQAQEARSSTPELDLSALLQGMAGVLRLAGDHGRRRPTHRVRLPERLPVVPGLDEPSERVAALKPRFSRTVFWAIIATGCVWPLLLVVAVDSYLGTGRLQVLLAVYTDSPGLYLLLFLSQVLWTALPFVAFAVLAQGLYESSAGEEATI